MGVRELIKELLQKNVEVMLRVECESRKKKMRI